MKNKTNPKTTNRRSLEEKTGVMTMQSFLRIIIVTMLMAFVPTQVFAMDTDGDGIENIVDLDDDNDGILDRDEMECHPDGYGAKTTTGTETVVTGAETITYTILSGGGVKKYTVKGRDAVWTNHGDTKLRYDFSPNLHKFVYRIIDLDGKEAVQLNIFDENGNRIGDLEPYITKVVKTDNEFTYVHTAINGLEIEVSTAIDRKNIKNYIEISMPFPISKLEIDFQHNGGSPGYVIWGACNDIDTDGDGTPDRLDKDSDGDGCPDALEGEAGFVYDDLNKTNRTLLGAVDTNGIPVVANGGQAIGSSRDSTTQSDECDECNANSSLFSDNDGDGIGDACDQDDDNDGILDASERLCQDEVPGDEDQDIDNNTYALRSGNVSFGSYDYVGGTTVNAGTGHGLFDEGWANVMHWTSTGTDPDADYVTFTTDFSYVRDDLDFTFKDVDGEEGIELIAYNNGIPVTPNNIIYNTANFTQLNPNAFITTNRANQSASNSDYWVKYDFKGLRIDRIVVRAFSTYAQNHGIGFVINTCNIDTDGDGMPDHLDTDADNDGCPDALEGSAGFIFDDLNKTSRTLLGSVDANGIPVVANDGQAIGSSRDNTMQSAECDTCNPASTLFVDTDGDGVGDDCDLDNDNDGILDSVECTRATHAMTFDANNTTVSWSGKTAANVTVTTSNPPDPYGHGPYKNKDNGGPSKFASTVTASDGTVMHIGNYFQLGTEDDSDYYYDIVFDHPVPVNELMFYFYDIDVASPNLSIEVTVDGGTASAQDFVGLGASANISGSHANAQYVAPNITKGSDSHTDQHLILKGNNSKTLTHIRFTSHIVGGYDAVVIALSSVLCDTDTDNDGTPDYLDIDSDGDGCSDADEAYDALGTDSNGDGTYSGIVGSAEVDEDGKVTAASYAAPATTASGQNTFQSAVTVSVDTAVVDQTESVGDAATFSAIPTVTLGATTPATTASTDVIYQWQISTDNGATFSDIAGASGTVASGVAVTYTTPVIVSADDGNIYKVEFSSEGRICPITTEATLIVQTAPAAVDDNATGVSGQATTLTPVNDNGNGADSDPENDINASSLVLTSSPVAGATVAANGKSITVPGEGVWSVDAAGNVTFTPDASFTGDPTPVGYKVSDNTNLQSNEAFIGIDYPQTAPAAVDDNATGVSGQATTLTPVNDNGNGADSDPENDINASSLVLTSSPVAGATVAANGKSITVPGEGTWGVDANGNVTFTPNDDFTGDPTPVGYKVSDNTNLQSNEAFIGIDYPQTAPTAVDDNATGVSGQATTLTPVNDNGNGADSDPENDINASSLVLTSSPVAGATVAANGKSITVPGEGTWGVDANGNVTFTPNDDFTGDPTPVGYKVSDNTNLQSNEAFIGIDYPQTAPTAVDDNATGVSGQATTLTPVNDNGNGADSDPENDINASSLVLTSSPVAGATVAANGKSITVPGEGTWGVDANGNVTFTPNDDFTGDPTPVGYKVSDNTNLQSNEAFIGIDYPQTAPAAVDDNATGVSGQATTLTPVNDNGNGADSDPENDINASSLVLTSSPVAGATVAANGKSITVPGEGTWGVDANGNVTFTPNDDFTGDPTPVGYKVSDNTNLQSNEAFIGIDYPQTAPAAVDDNATGVSGQATTLTPVNDNGNGADSDPENDINASSLVLTSSPVAGATVAANGKSITVPGEGVWSVDAAGNVTFTPDASFTGDPTPVGYKVSDNTNLQSNEAFIGIDYPQTAPTAVDDNATGVSGQATTLTPVNDNGNGADSDPENDINASSLVLTSSPVAGATVAANGKSITVPGEGVWSVDAAGNVTFTPDASFTGDPTPVGYKVSDNTNLQSNEAFIGIDYPQTAPTAVDDNATGVSGQATTLTPVNDNGNGADSDPENDINASSLVLTSSPVAGATVAANGKSITVPGEGVWSVDAAGNVTFTPDASFTGDPTPVGYKVSDNTNLQSNEAFIGIDYPQTAPAAVDDNATGIPSNPVTIDPFADNGSGTDSDPENDLNKSSLVLTGTTAPGAVVAADGKSITVAGEGIWTVDEDGNVTFTPEAGFLDDPTPVTYEVSDNTGLTSNEATISIDYADLYDVSGNVGIDLDEDSASDSAPLEPVTLALLNEDGTPALDLEGNPYTTTTDANGDYSFENVLGGNYTIVETDPAGTVSVADTEGAGDDNAIAITLENNEDSTDNNFVDAPQRGDLAGTVFKDDNNDTLFNGSEQPLANIDIIVTDVYGVEHNVTTDENGDYSVPNLPVGSTTVVVQSDDPDIPEGAANTGATTPATVEITVGETLEHDIGFLVPDPLDIDPADIATCAHPTSITWEGATVSSSTQWRDLTAPKSGVVTVGGKTVEVNFGLSDDSGQVNYDDDGASSAHAGTNDNSGTPTASAFPQPYLTLYLGTQEDNTTTDLSAGESATLTVDFNESVILDNWRIRDIDVGDKRGAQSGWPWQDAVQMKGYDANGNEVTLKVTLSGETNLEELADGFVQSVDAETGSGTDSTAAKGHAVWSSDGVPVRRLVLVHKAGSDIAAQTRAAIALSGFAVCKPLTISGTVFDDANGASDGATPNGTPLGTVDGAPLYAHLVDSAGNVVDVVEVDATTGEYIFDKHINKDTNYTVQLSTVETEASNPMPPVELPDAWHNVSEDNSTDALIDGSIPVAVGTEPVEEIDFGLDKAPNSGDVDAPTELNPGGTTDVPLIDAADLPSDINDSEDGVPATMVIETLPATGTLYYDGVPVTEGQVIEDIDYRKLTVDPDDGNVTVSFNFHMVDEANVSSPSAVLSKDFYYEDPVAQDDNASNPNPIDPSNPTTVDVIGTDTNGTYAFDPSTVNLLDPSGNEVKTLVVPGEGTWTVNPDGTITFTPAEGFYGDPTPVEYTVEDTEGNEVTATVTVTYPHTNPIAVDDNVTNPNPATPTNPTVLPTVGNDTDDENDIDPSTVNITTEGATDSDGDGDNDTLVVSGEGTWRVNPETGDTTFTPEEGFTGDPTPITYTVEDHTGLVSEDATQTVDYPQTLRNDKKSGEPGESVTVDVLANDDQVNPETVQIIDPVTGEPTELLEVPGEGTWTVGEDGNITFTPVPDFTGDPTPIQYTAKDTNGNEIDPAMVTVDYPQELKDDNVTNPNPTSPDNPTVVDVLVNDSTVDPTTVKIIDPETGDLVDELEAQGEGTWTVDPETGRITFTPAEGFTGDPTPIQYTAEDTNGIAVDPATVTIDYLQTPPVTERDYAHEENQTKAVIVPVLENDSDNENDINASTVDFNASSVPGGVGSDIDGDGDIDQVVVPGEGTWTVDDEGVVTFEPVATLIGDPTPITYTITDDTGLVSNPSEIYVDYPPYVPQTRDDEAINPDPASPENPTSLSAVENDGDLDDDLNISTVNFDSDSVPGGIGTDTDDDGDIDQVVVPGEGRWTVNEDGVVTFTPEEGFTGDPTPIDYTVKDAGGLVSPSATITVDYPQELVDDSATGTQGNPVTVNVLVNDDEVDPTTVQIINPESNETVTELTIVGEGIWSVDEDGNITFAPNRDFTGDPTPIRYTAKDTNGNAVNPATVTVDYPQELTDDYAVGVLGSSVTVDVLANDNTVDPATVKIVDSEGNLVTVLEVAGEGSWSVDPVTGKITFTPEGSFTGDPTPIEYMANDTNGNAVNPATVTVDYPQELTDDYAVGVLGSSVTVDVLANDNTVDPATVKIVDSEGNLVTVLEVAGEGSWSVDPVTGKITFTPEGSFTGDPTPIEYMANDTNGNAVNPATVTVDYPQASHNDMETGTLGDSVTVDVLANDDTVDPTTVRILNPDGDPVSELVVPGEGNWTVDPTTGEITFVPEAGFTGDPTPISYTAQDTNGNSVEPATVIIDYLQSARDDNATGVSGRPVVVDVLANDDALDSTTVQIVDPATNETTDTLVVENEGIWSVNEDGNITFTPNEDFTGDPTPIQYIAKDTNGNLVAPATVTVDYPQGLIDDEVSNPNPASPDNPTVVDVLANDSIVDSSTVKIIDPETNETVDELMVDGEGNWSVNPETGAVTFTPEKGFEGDPTPVLYTANDTNGNPVEPAKIVIDYPQLINNDSATGNLGEAVVIDVLANDGAVDPTTVQIVDPDGGLVTELEIPGEGTWSVNPETGAITFVPEEGFTGDPTPIQYTAEDTNGNSAGMATVSVDYPDDTATVRATFWFDDNEDGKKDTGERYVADGTIVELLDEDGNPVPCSKGLSSSLMQSSETKYCTQPTKDGKVEFKNLPRGKYQLRFTLSQEDRDDGYRFTTKEGVKGDTLTVPVDVSKGKPKVATAAAAISCECAGIATDSGDAMGTLTLLLLGALMLMLGLLGIDRKENA